MKNYNKKKIITISVLAVAAVLLAGGLWVYVDSMGNSEPAAIIENDTTQEPDGSETPDIKIPINSEQNTQAGDTEGNESGEASTPSAESTPSTAGNGTSGQTKPSDGKPKTPAEATPPPTPETDHEPSGSAAPSSSTPTPAKPETDTPQSGDTNSNGAIYVPGFGWVENSGENSQGTAPNAGTGEKVGQ